MRDLDGLRLVELGRSLKLMAQRGSNTMFLFSCWMPVFTGGKQVQHSKYNKHSTAQDDWGSLC